MAECIPSGQPPRRTEPRASDAEINAWIEKRVANDLCKGNPSTEYEWYAFYYGDNNPYNLDNDEVVTAKCGLEPTKPAGYDDWKAGRAPNSGGLQGGATAGTDESGTGNESQLTNGAE